jgi:two-component system OmpR family sensor kinase
LSAALEHERSFIADAAHELRSPLTALSLQLQSLAAAENEADRGEAARQLAAGVARATRLVEQLLTLARQERGTTREFRDVDLDEVARTVVTELVPLADARRIDLGIARADRTVVRGDPDALHVLIRNVVDNAVRYTPEGGRVDVAVSRIDSGEHRQAIVEVSDTGPGIPAAELARVFDRFYRVPGSDAAGSGIGLAIAKAIADRHAASIELGPGAGGAGLLVRVSFAEGQPA